MYIKVSEASQLGANDVMAGQNFKSFIACGKSGSFMSFICCGIFIFFTADTARAGAAAIPAFNKYKVKKMLNIASVANLPLVFPIYFGLRFLLVFQSYLSPIPFLPLPIHSKYNELYLHEK